MYDAAKKLDRVLEIARMDLKHSKIRDAIDNELETAFSDLYELIQDLDADKNYLEEKLRNTLLTAKIASGLIVDEGMSPDTAKKNIVTEIYFLKSRLTD